MCVLWYPVAKLYNYSFLYKLNLHRRFLAVLIQLTGIVQQYVLALCDYKRFIGEKISRTR